MPWIPPYPPLLGWNCQIVGPHRQPPSGKMTAAGQKNVAVTGLESWSPTLCASSSSSSAVRSAGNTSSCTNWKPHGNTTRLKYAMEWKQSAVSCHPSKSVLQYPQSRLCQNRMSLQLLSTLWVKGEITDSQTTSTRDIASNIKNQHFLRASFVNPARTRV